jgi:hypothetical protein
VKGRKNRIKKKQDAIFLTMKDAREEETKNLPKKNRQEIKIMMILVKALIENLIARMNSPAKSQWKARLLLKTVNRNLVETGKFNKILNTKITTEITTLQVITKIFISCFKFYEIS